MPSLKDMLIEAVHHVDTNKLQEHDPYCIDGVLMTPYQLIMELLLTCRSDVE